MSPTFISDIYLRHLHRYYRYITATITAKKKFAPTFTPTKQQQPFPTNNTRDEKLRKIGRLLVNMAKDELIVKSPNGKKWQITEKGEKELY